MNRFSNHYETLGVRRDSASEEIRAAYRKLARKYHPDRNNGCRAAEETFKVVSEAYEILIDPIKRRNYDLYTDFARGSAHARYRPADRTAPRSATRETSGGRARRVSAPVRMRSVTLLVLLGFYAFLFASDRPNMRDRMDRFLAFGLEELQSGEVEINGEKFGPLDYMKSGAVELRVTPDELATPSETEAI